MDRPSVDIMCRGGAEPQGHIAPRPQNPFLCYLASLPTLGSRKTQGGSLAVLTRRFWKCEPAELDWTSLELEDLLSIRAWLGEHYAPSTANRILCALRRVLHFARRLGLLTEDRYLALSELKDIAGSRLRPGRALTLGELKAMFGMLNMRNAHDARDAALLAILFGAGLRRAEASDLDLEHYDRASGALRVLGKGNKERLCYLPKGAQAAVRAWLRHRGEAAGPLLWPTDHGELRARRFTVDGVRSAVAALGQRCGIPHFSPHDLRRTYISTLLDANAELVNVQRLAGHSSPQTTARYDRRPDAARARTAELVCVPFVDEEEPQP